MKSNLDQAKAIIAELLALPDLSPDDRRTVTTWQQTIEKSGSYAQVTADHLLRLRTLGENYGLFPPDNGADAHVNSMHSTPRADVLEAKRIIDGLLVRLDTLPADDRRYTLSWKHYFERKGSAASVGPYQMVHLTKVGALYGLVTAEVAADRLKAVRSVNIKLD